MATDRKLRSCLLLVIVLGLIAFGLPAHSQESAAEAQTETASDDHTAQPIAKDGAEAEPDEPSELLAPIEAIGSAIRDIVDEQRRAATMAPDENQERDLKAQEEMAYWAKPMFYVAFSSVATSAFGVFLIWHTLLATRKAAEYAKSAADAGWATVKHSETAASAAVANITVTKALGDRQSRPSLANLERSAVCKLLDNGNISCRFLFTYQNFGPTVAIVKRSAVTLFQNNVSSGGEYNSTSGSQNLNARAVQPNEIMKLSVQSPFEPGIIQNGQKLYICVRFEYEGVLNYFEPWPEEIQWYCASAYVQEGKLLQFGIRSSAPPIGCHPPEYHRWE